MIIRKELKQISKEQLRGKWAMVIAVFVTLLLISLIFNLPSMYYPTSVFLGTTVPLLSLLITAPLALGQSIFFLNLSKNQNPKYSDLFLGFNNFLKSIGVTLLVGVIVLLGFILLIVPGIILSFSYSQVYYVLAENPDISVWECLKESSRIMKGKKMDYFILSLSFILWIILIPITLGLASLYVAPYIQTTLTNFYLHLDK